MKQVYPTTLKCYEMIWKSHGIQGLYRGMFPSLMREIIGYGCYFGFYDWSLRGLTQGRKENASTLHILLSGALGGIMFWGTSFPFDTIKTLYQTDNLVKPKYKNICQAFQTTIKEKGY